MTLAHGYIARTMQSRLGVGYGVRDYAGTDPREKEITAVLGFHHGTVRIVKGKFAKEINRLMDIDISAESHR